MEPCGSTVSRRTDQLLCVEYKAIKSLKPNPNNARSHSKHQISQNPESLQAFGITNPVLVDSECMIPAGHGRVEAAKLLGITEMPAIRLDRHTKEQTRGYVIADNKLAENAVWDWEILAIEFQELLALESLSVTITGFDYAEVDLILEEAKGDASPDDVPLETVLDQVPIAQFGDLWLLEKHRIICGNALHQATYRKLMGERRAAAVVTGPSYYVRINGHATANGRIRHREFAMASREMSEAEFTSSLNITLHHLSEIQFK